MQDSYYIISKATKLSIRKFYEAKKFSWQKNRNKSENFHPRLYSNCYDDGDQCRLLYFITSWLSIVSSLKRGLTQNVHPYLVNVLLDNFDCIKWVFNHSTRDLKRGSLTSQTAFSSFILGREEKGSGILTNKILCNVLPSLR